MNLFRFKTFFLLAVAMLSVVSACKTTHKRSDVLIATGLGIFRSVNFDMDIENVKKYETATLVNSTENYLRYEIKNIGNTPEYAEIEYHFSKDRLDLITVFYSAENSEAMEAIFQEMKNYYNEKYEKAASENAGWQRWEFEDKEGLPGTIEIMMKHESINDIHGLDIEIVKYYKDERRTAAALTK